MTLEKRPTRRDAAPIAIEAMRKELEGWLGGPMCDKAKDAAVRALADYYDGFEIAKELDDSFYWGSDRRLCEIMDGAWWRVDDALSSLLSDWANKQPGLSDMCPEIGAQVTVQVFGKPRPGEVLRIDPKNFTAIVHCDVDNHGPTEGWVIPWEKVQQ